MEARSGSDLAVRLTRLPGHDDLPVPSYATEGAAGADLYAAVAAPVTLEPGDRDLIPTGIRLALPAGYEGQIRPRSGKALREGLTLLNSPGTVDADYRGEIRVLVINLGREPVVIRRGDRIAQMIVSPVARVVFQETAMLPDTERGDGGFGHTGE